MVDTIRLFCIFCQTMKRGAVCRIHRHDALLPETCTICKPVIFTNGNLSDGSVSPNEVAEDYREYHRKKVPAEAGKC